MHVIQVSEMFIGVSRLRRVIGVLTLAVVVSASFAAYWVGENLSLRAEIQNLEAELARSFSSVAVVSQSPSIVLPQASCEPRLPLTPSTLQALCAEHTQLFSKEPIIGETAISKSLKESVRLKYASLFQQAGLTKEDYEVLAQLLARREGIANAPVHGYFSDHRAIEAQVLEQGEQLNRVDRDIAVLLDDASLQAYHLLKNSEFEQYQLNEFVDSLPIGRITDSQQHQLLLSKLSFKQTFEEQLARSTEASPLAREQLKEMLNSYRSGFYRDVAAILDGNSYQRLRAYEESQFDALYQSLLRQAED